MRIYPWEYTDRKGGSFKPWIYGCVSKKSLSKRGMTVIINGVVVHSLIFESASAGICGDVIARWDSINGWTKTIEEAKEIWPLGLHGQRCGMDHWRKILKESRTTKR
jgi:hypothetical protein